MDKKFLKGYILGKSSGGGGSSGTTYTNYSPIAHTTDKIYAIEEKPQNVLDAVRHTTVEIKDGIAYVIGGTDSTDTLISDVSAYDLATWDKTVKTPMPVAMDGMRSVRVGSKIYVIGGWDGSNLRDTLRIYDIDTNLWSLGASMTTARTLPAIATYGGKIYVVGGGSTQSMEIYDIASNTWSDGADYGNIVENAPAVYWDGYMYVFGGYNGTSDITTSRRYEIATDTWENLTGVTHAVTAAGAGVVNGKVILIGGYNHNTDALIYDISDDSYTGPGIYMPNGKDQRGYAVYANKIYLFGGYLGTTEARNIHSTGWETTYLIASVPSGTKVKFDKIVFDGVDNHPANVEFTTTEQVILSSYESGLTGYIR